MTDPKKMALVDVHRPNKVIRLPNKTCPYCQSELKPGRWDRDHVIGRSFVPRGSLKSSWNLHVKTCKKCNNEKSHLENDISAISMYQAPDPASGASDALVVAERERKAAGSISQHTGRPVADSEQKIVIKSRFGQATVSATMIGPPVAQDDRIYSLALMHVQAIFYYYTFDRKEHAGCTFIGDFCPVGCFTKTDWGNDALRWFMGVTSSWNYQFLGIGADGYFKIVIRIHPQGRPVTAWALEWNRNFRIVGFCGNEEDTRDLENSAQRLQWNETRTGADTLLRYRRHIALEDADDILFAVGST